MPNLPIAVTGKEKYESFCLYCQKIVYFGKRFAHIAHIFAVVRTVCWYIIISEKTGLFFVRYPPVSSYFSFFFWSTDSFKISVLSCKKYKNFSFLLAFLALKCCHYSLNPLNWCWRIRSESNMWIIFGLSLPSLRIRSQLLQKWHALFFLILRNCTWYSFLQITFKSTVW